ncbi:conserved hypothetical protein [Burkholderiales bacterium 8X]|nr:conserved hypothetical protein [Burkholderiales bacterium 8X]
MHRLVQHRRQGAGAVGPLLGPVSKRGRLGQAARQLCASPRRRFAASGARSADRRAGRCRSCHAPLDLARLRDRCRRGRAGRRGAAHLRRVGCDASGRGNRRAALVPHPTHRRCAATDPAKPVAVHTTPGGREGAGADANPRRPGRRSYAGRPRCRRDAGELAAASEHCIDRGDQPRQALRPSRPDAGARARRLVAAAGGCARLRAGLSARRVGGARLRSGHVGGEATGHRLRLALGLRQRRPVGRPPRFRFAGADRDGLQRGRGRSLGRGKAARLADADPRPGHRLSDGDVHGSGTGSPAARRRQLAGGGVAGADRPLAARTRAGARRRRHRAGVDRAVENLRYIRFRRALCARPQCNARPDATRLGPAFDAAGQPSAGLALITRPGSRTRSSTSRS